MRPIFDHEIHHVAPSAPLTAGAALEIFELPALFLGVMAVWSFILGAVPWWLYAGAGFYGALSVLTVGYELWRIRS